MQRSRRIARVAAVVVAAAGLAALIALLFTRTDAPQGSTATASSAAVSGPGDSGRNSSLLPAYPTSGPSRVIAADEVDLCGVGVVALDSEDLLKAILDAEAVLIAEARRLQGSGNNSERSTGLALEARLAAEAPVRTATRRRGADCWSEPDCIKPALDDGARAAFPLVEALVSMAIATRDSRIYAKALHVCSISTPDLRQGSCLRIGYADWAAIDPSNAIPWIGKATEDRARGDDRSAAEAIRKAASAEFVDHRYVRPVELLAGLPRTSEATRAALMGLLTVVTGANPIPNYVALSSYCKKASLEDADRRSVCAELGRKFMERGQTLWDSAIAFNLMAQQGLPEEEMRALTESQNALQRVLGEENHDLYSCAWLSRAEVSLPRRSREGELAYTRSILKQQSKSKP